MWERLDTWLILGLLLWLLVCFLLDRCNKVKKLKQELKARRRAEHRAWLACEKARRQKRQMAARAEAVLDHTRACWKEEVAELELELAKKERLLNQKWREARENVQN